MGGVDSSWLMARVEIRGLHKEFEGTVAVENLDLEVKDKEFVVLLGPSGCGKTTTLRCIAGLESPSEGEIYIGDRLVNDLEPKERNVAMVFQSYALYPHMTVFQNLAFPLENARVSERDIVNRVNRTATLLRTLARAERDQVEAMTMADRVALLHKGTLQQYAGPRDLYSRPTNQFVAGFVGNPPINLIECNCIDGNMIDAGDFRLALPERLVEPCRNSSAREIVLGVRPQDVQVGSPPDSDGGVIVARFPPTSVPAEIYATEPLGDSTILDLKVGDKLLKAVVAASFEGDVGAKIGVQFPSDRIHLFHRKSGQAIR